MIPAPEVQSYSLSLSFKKLGFRVYFGRSLKAGCTELYCLILVFFF